MLAKVEGETYPIFSQDQRYVAGYNWASKGPRQIWAFDLLRGRTFVNRTTSRVPYHVSIDNKVATFLFETGSELRVPLR